VKYSLVLLKEVGLQDHYDVKMPCHLLLAKLAAAAPGPVLASLDCLVGPLEKTLTTRLRGEPVKQEVSTNNPSCSDESDNLYNHAWLHVSPNLVFETSSRAVFTA